MDSVSLRPLVVQGVEPFAESFGPLRRQVADILVEMTVGLSHYSEEGFAFAPIVFVTDDLPAALSLVRGTEPILVGSDPLSEVAARMALRTCGPLGVGRRWAIFVVPNAQKVEFGIFRLEGSVLRPTSFELLRRADQVAPKVIGMAQLRTGVVELRSSRGKGRYFDFSGGPEQATNPGQVVQSFVGAVTSAAPVDVRPQLEAFYYRMGVDILTADHGTLAVVVAAEAPPPAFLADGIWLSTPVNLSSWIRKDSQASNTEAAQTLFAYEQLLRRMTMMDGITVFGSDGTGRAYHCFLREPAPSGPFAFRSGGARRRAFDHICTYLGDSVKGVLYRSQDGAADCAVA